jgi:uncharacterized protein with von Willebrand factor type A (vWA) domain
VRYRYSRWDGTQRRADLDAGEVLHALADDLVAGGELSQAIQRLAVRGMPPPAVSPLPGLDQLLQQVQDDRQRALAHYDLESILDGIRREVEAIVTAEHEALRARLMNSEGAPEQRAVLSSVVEAKQSVLDRLPADPAGAIAALHRYEFSDALARVNFEALEDRLADVALQGQVRDMVGGRRGLADEGLAALTNLLHELNTLMDEQAAGGQPDLEGLIRSHGQLYPGVSSMDDLVGDLAGQAADSEALLSSVSTGVRRGLEEACSAVLPDPVLGAELSHLRDTMRVIAPFRPPAYPFAGDVELSLEEALGLMRRMGDLDRMEASLVRARESGDLHALDLEMVCRTLGSEAARAVEDLRGVADMLEASGYAHRAGDELELTARGIRKIGEKALHDIFSHLKRDAFGDHAIQHAGSGTDRTAETTRYQFGDPFLLDLSRTVMNGVVRGGPGLPVRLRAGDLEVYRTEYLTQSATVLMLDMSRSMPLRGCFVAAKRVALALQSLILTQFPRDRLHVLAFSEYAREIRPEALHQLTWGEQVYGTNMQHGFMLARRLLGRHTAGTKQIILITDGEPTAHWEDNRVHFAYPPTHRTVRETLREVTRCTREGIVINTFMLERSHYLTDFVDQVSRINRGRAFFATPERLGDYVVVDYVASKAKRAGLKP